MPANAARQPQLPDGTSLKQSDATGWMGMFCLNLMRISLELASQNPAYSGMATKFVEHYAYIGSAMKNAGNRNFELWSERDGFFYDVLCYGDSSYHKFRVRSLVGLIPLYAIERLQEDWLAPHPSFLSNLNWFLANRAHLTQFCINTVEREGKRIHVLSLMNEEQLRRVLGRVWSADEFLSPHGLRSLSKYHEEHPFAFGGNEVRYEPAESISQLKGGNSNWRGPVWFPTTFLMIESLRKLGQAYGPTFTVENPGGGPAVTPGEMARGLADRMIGLFARDRDGRRPVHGNREKFQHDPHWRDLILFYEYFNGETGEGLGASHQTGWTGLVATLIDEWRR